MAVTLIVLPHRRRHIVAMYLKVASSLLLSMPSPWPNQHLISRPPVLLSARDHTLYQIQPQLHDLFTIEQIHTPHQGRARQLSQ